MRQRAAGQSMVEMAFVLPILLLVTFGIIDMAYYVYSYGTVYQSVRNAAEAAASLPPYPARVGDANDLCVKNIRTAGSAKYYDANMHNQIQISYPPAADGSIRRGLGEPIKISLTHKIKPLTPLWNLANLNSAEQGTFTITVSTVRSIENLGDNPTTGNLVACQP